MKKLLIPLIVLLGFSLSISAQEKSRKEKKGDRYVFNYSYTKAIKAYESTKQLTTEGQRNLAASYHNMNQNIQAEEAYATLVALNSGVIAEDYYNYAMALKINGDYNKSALWMDKFVASKPGDLRGQDYARNKVELTYLLADDGKYGIESMNINTPADDYGPAYYNDKIVFSSSRSSHPSSAKKYKWTGKPFYNIYVAEVENGQLKNPKNFNKHLNGKLHDGPVSFSNQGTIIAFTRNHYHDRSKDRVVELQLWFSSFVDGKWQKPVPFAYNSSDYSVGQPCLSEDGKTLYFTSDMPGGFGGADLYRSTKDMAGNWGTPKNLGNAINTEGDELFPYVQEKNAVMFFASNGRFGLGGLDIFMCKIEGSGFGAAYNAGAPLNTRDDDFGAIVNDKMKDGYFTSNRSGGSGGDDLFSLDLLNWGEKPLPVIGFLVDAPTNIVSERSVREIFPLRNYVFFDIGSTMIPDRYVLLSKEQVKEFKEEQVEMFVPKNLSGRSSRQMTVYYNLLNILGDRMVRYPTTTIKLLGASEKGPDDGLLMATSVKQYLVEIFGINASRITLEGRDKPKLPSEQPGQTGNEALYLQADRRVSIESSSPTLLMEFQNGSDAPLKPIEFVSVQGAPVESYVSFTVDPGANVYKSWSLEITDKDGLVQRFGPYTHDEVSIPGKSILGKQKEGDYNVRMITTFDNNVVVQKDTLVHMVLWAPPKTAEILRFTILYGFDESKAILMYEKYLTEIVVPRIPMGAKVLIHGYTDILGETDYNLALSLRRATDVENILMAALTKLGRNDVIFDLHGFGEDESVSLFGNELPEERFYNRTVMIDVIPATTSNK